MRLDLIFETALYVTDLESAKVFYEQLMDAPALAAAPERHVSSN